MYSSADEIVVEVPRLLRIYKDGRVEKLSGTDTVPAGIDPVSGVHSKEVVIQPDTPLSVRLYKPQTPTTQKLPLLIYFHGGGFVIESTASPVYHNFLNLIASESNAVVVSVDYRTAPEHPVPACFDDSWEAIKWVAAHATGNGPEQWINEHADLGNVYFAGDSAGGTIAHHMAIRVGSENPDVKLNLKGIALLHPYFWGIERVGSEADNPFCEMIPGLWKLACPGTSGADDPWINPDKDPKVSGLGCSRVLVYVAELDILKDRGLQYKGILGRNGWTGDVEVIEDKGENHVYFLFNPSVDSACNLRTRVCNFINNRACVIGIGLL